MVCHGSVHLICCSFRPVACSAYHMTSATSFRYHMMPASFLLLPSIAYLARSFCSPHATRYKNSGTHLYSRPCRVAMRICRMIADMFLAFS